MNKIGLVVGWACGTANVHDSHFLHLVERYKDQMIILLVQQFHSKEGDPPNSKLCERGLWNERMLIETVLSMLATISHFKKIAHRVWEYFYSHLAFAMAAFNILVQWYGLKPDENGFIPLSIAEFNL